MAINELINDLKTDQTMLTAVVIWTLHPELSLKQVFERLDDPAEILTMIQEILLVPDGSIDELKGDII